MTALPNVIGDRPDIQRNFDVLLAEVLLRLKQSDEGAYKIYAGRLFCGLVPAVTVGVGITGIARLGAGSYRLTHDATTGAAGYLFAGLATCQGNTGTPRIAHFAPQNTTTSDLYVTDAAGAAVDGDIVYFVGVG